MSRLEHNGRDGAHQPVGRIRQVGYAGGNCGMSHKVSRRLAALTLHSSRWHSEVGDSALPSGVVSVRHLALGASLMLPHRHCYRIGLMVAELAAITLPFGLAMMVAFRWVV